MVEDQDQELCNMACNAQHPIDMAFNAVENHAKHGEMGRQPLRQSETIAKAHVTLNKTQCFKQPITDWNRGPTAEQTWINLKVDFRRAHQEFRETTDVTLNESELQCNKAHLVQQVVNGMQQAMANKNTTDEEAMLQMTNLATRASKTHAQLHARLQQMQQSMHLLQAQVANNQGHAPKP
jgi:hypothetical protein